MKKMNRLGHVWMWLLPIAALLLVVPAGCGGRSKAPDMARMDKAAVEAAQSPVNILDPDLRKKVAADLAKAQRLPNGRLQAAVNLRNSSKKDLTILVRVVFKDEAGISTGDETEWKQLFLQPQQIQTISETSLNKKAESFTVEVTTP